MSELDCFDFSPDIQEQENNREPFSEGVNRDLYEMASRLLPSGNNRYNVDDGEFY